MKYYSDLYLWTIVIYDLGAWQECSANWHILFCKWSSFKLASGIALKWFRWLLFMLLLFLYVSCPVVDLVEVYIGESFLTLWLLKTKQLLEELVFSLPDPLFRKRAWSGIWCLSWQRRVTPTFVTVTTHGHPKASCAISWPMSKTSKTVATEEVLPSRNASFFRELN
jgi:hypothetical protein